MIGEQTIQSTIYEAITKLMIRRLERAIPGSSEEAFHQLSLAAMLNLLFLINGEFGSLGDFVTTHRTLRALLGDKLLWAEPQKSASVPESIN